MPRSLSGISLFTSNVLRVPLALAILLQPSAGALAQPGTEPLAGDRARGERARITERIAELRRIGTPEGIEEMELIDVDGDKQWITIRGLNRANPVLLMIHGGPGAPMMPSSWAFQTPWEDFFTVVQWDQRGVGRNAAHSDHEALAADMSVERHLQDTAAVVRYLRERLDQDKIFVMGFSWGSALGLLFAQRHPEWLYAYVGVGQDSGFLTGLDPEVFIYQRLLEMSEAKGDEAALAELRAVAPYPGPGEPDIEHVMTVRKWARVYDGGWYGKDTFDLWFSLAEWAPEYTPEDVDGWLAAIRWSATQVLGDLRDTKREAAELRFEVPILFLMGRYDLHTPYDPSLELFRRIEAPRKEFITFERSSHFPMFEEPGRFLMTLVEEVLPLAGETPVFERLD